MLFTFGILAFSLCGILLTYINMFIFTDLARDFTLATNALQAEMEDIKRQNFDNLSSFNGTPFDMGGFASLDAKGRVEVTDTSYGDLKRIRLVACFKSRGRLIGEDANLDGDLDTGEDTLWVNNRLDSPVELVTLIAK